MRPIVNCDENDLEILWFCLLCYDWSRNLAPPYQPINRDLAIPIFKQLWCHYRAVRLFRSALLAERLEQASRTAAIAIKLTFSNSSADYCKFVSFLLA